MYVLELMGMIILFFCSAFIQTRVLAFFIHSTIYAWKSGRDVFFLLLPFSRQRRRPAATTTRSCYISMLITLFILTILSLSKQPTENSVICDIQVLYFTDDADLKHVLGWVWRTANMATTKLVNFIISRRSWRLASPCKKYANYMLFTKSNSVRL